MTGQPGCFDVDERYAALSAAGDPLERLEGVVGFELFRPVLDGALARSDRSRGGRPPDEGMLMFRILALQALHRLSDEQAEFQLRDRLSFMRLLGLALHEAVPDARTIWLYREQLKQAGTIDGLFRRFAGLLDAANTASRSWTDPAYRTTRNLEVLERRGLTELRADHRPAASKGEDRHGQPGLQRRPPRLAQHTNCSRIGQQPPGS